jgi:hypothetical protein
MRRLDKVSWTIILLASATLGLAPFTPEPHVWEKLKMLVSGDLSRGIDWLDLTMHGAPFLVLALKAARESAKIRKR